MKSNKEFMEDVKHASSLPAQTQRALAPESQEDIAMYANDSQQNKTSEKNNPNGPDRNESLGGSRTDGSGDLDKTADIKIDANCEGDENVNN